MENTIIYSRTLENVDWAALKAKLLADDFDNGRSPELLQKSFANSAGVCFAWADGQVVGKARALSDGVCNAYIVDVWTWTPYRKRGIATEMLRQLMADLPGQHVYLQADDDLVPFYERLKFGRQPNGMFFVVGRWLDSTPVSE